MDSVNPSTGEVYKQYETYTSKQLDNILDKSQKAYKKWSGKSLQHREMLLSNVADVLDTNKQQYAETMTKEMGKPIEQSLGEVEKCSWLCRHYAKNAGSYLSDDVHESPSGVEARTVYEPLGTVLAVMPWNFPFWQVFRFAAPYLTAGNVGILKHASSVPECSINIEEIFKEAGYPEDVFQSLLIGSDKVSELIDDERVRAATLTGSEPAGSAVAEQAGSNIKKTVLELGGSDPFIVLEDADLQRAAEVGTWARNQNNGQSCIAAKRFIIVEAVYEEFLGMLKDNFASLTIGDPNKEETDIGPQSSRQLMMDMQRSVEESVNQGAKIEMGGEPIDREGFYYPPTILTDITRGSPVDNEEIFGPVASVYKVKDKSEAVKLANETKYGLGASIWTESTEKGRDVSSQISAGAVYINELVKSDPRVPFGGVGISGYGRELSEVGIKEFTNKKTVWINHR